MTEHDPGARTRPEPNRDSPQGPEPGPGAGYDSKPIMLTLLDPALALAADVLDDIERVRIANENRLRQLTRTEADSDGEERGFGLPEDHPDVARVAGIVGALKDIEGDAIRNLQRHMKRHPLWPWSKTQRGVGEKQLARLLAVIGDPYFNGSTEKPRTVSALWAYSGLHVVPGGQSRSDDQESHAAGDEGGDPDPGLVDDQAAHVWVAARRKKGVRSNWSSKAKMRAYLIAESCVKQLDKACKEDPESHVALGASQQGPDALGTPASPQSDSGAGQNGADTQTGFTCSCSPFRVKYDLRKAHTRTTRPEWTDGHRHNDALRVASKEILKQLWREAKAWHERQEEQGA